MDDIPKCHKKRGSYGSLSFINKLNLANIPRRSSTGAFRPYNNDSPRSRSTSPVYDSDSPRACSPTSELPRFCSSPRIGSPRTVSPVLGSPRFLRHKYSPRSLVKLLMQSPRNDNKDVKYIEKICPTIVSLIHEGEMVYTKVDNEVWATYRDFLKIVFTVEENKIKLKNVIIGGIEYCVEKHSYSIIRAFFYAVQQFNIYKKKDRGRLDRRPSMSKIDWNDDDLKMDLEMCTIHIKEDGVYYIDREELIPNPLAKKKFRLSDGYKYDLLKFILANREKLDISIKYNNCNNIIDIYRHDNLIFTVNDCPEILYFLFYWLINGYPYHLFVQVIYFL